MPPDICECGARDIFQAIEQNCAKCFDTFASQHSARQPDTQQTPLMLAAELGNVLIVEKLVPSSAGLQDTDGHTSLYYTLKRHTRGSYKCAQVLSACSSEHGKDS